jgi:hypothetical protein
MSLRRPAWPVLAFSLPACAVESSSVGAAATGEQQAAVRLAEADVSDYLALDHSQSTNPVCGDGCDPNCVDVGRYRVADGVVYDSAANLFWERDSGPQRVFSDALAYCAGLSLGGADSGWRLPTDAELRNILFKPGGLKAPLPGIAPRQSTKPPLPQHRTTTIGSPIAGALGPQPSISSTAANTASIRIRQQTFAVRTTQSRACGSARRGNAEFGALGPTVRGACARLAERARHI